ncbi:uncharacterized protein N7482_002581 [Penicillium canariense]|uniref:Uncharacterized protein n=1 Tax=Penicillium canariense TaxID=189055 RepID=A0A9W9LUZ0_9EURO|nr:uncharacterized protein N7482_002581 [Penicillium canariense]KAJ5176704.1 hypothetical protein N7482_002581 [Penicillium canariense]
MDITGPPCNELFRERYIFCLLGVFGKLLPNHIEVFLAARPVNGIATVTRETLLVQVITDMLFLCGRAFWTGVYLRFIPFYLVDFQLADLLSTGYCLGLFLGPVIIGNISPMYIRLHSPLHPTLNFGRFGWRSFFWLSLAMTTFSFLTALFCFPETKLRGEKANGTVTNELNNSECKRARAAERLRKRDLNT